MAPGRRVRQNCDLWREADQGVGSVGIGGGVGVRYVVGVASGEIVAVGVGVGVAVLACSNTTGA
jgi:hypothetical protein